MQVDVDKNRSSRKYSPRELLGRVAWASAQPLFRLSPRPLHGWRRFLLRAFGATIGPAVHIDPSARIFHPWLLFVGEGAAIGARVQVYNLGPIRIGARSTISQGAHLCGGSHDYRQPDFPLLRQGITVGSDAWVAADAFVGPGVTVGDAAVVAARAVVVKDVEAQVIVGGNPARKIGRR